ncbi:MAG: DUF953 domain-containing protein [Candidatus Micrarchaeota archaeon]|nr:DUF953 domain-containing protein [Candidatus Micrarchaeota archaeon]
MPYMEINAENPENAYREFQRIFAEHELSRKPMVAYFFGGESSKNIWCSWCRAAEPVFARLAERFSDAVDVYAVAVGNEENWKNMDSGGARINPFFANAPNVVSVPTLVVAAVYHGAFRIAARVSIPEDPTELDLEKIVSAFVKLG